MADPTVRLHLVRHGRAAGRFDESLDPGLDEVGVTQARAAADALGPLGPLPILTSPLRRCRETAAPLAERWGMEATVEPRVAEIPSPTNDLVARGAWLREAMEGTWADLDDGHRVWRDGVVDALVGVPQETVIFSHFVAICAAVGHATGDDRLVCFSPQNGSITTIETDGSALRLVALGEHGVTQVG